MSGVARATYTHRQEERRGWYAQHDIGDRSGEERVSVARCGCARARGAQPTRQAQSVGTHGGDSAALCDRDGGGRECASLGTGV